MHDDMVDVVDGHPQFLEEISDRPLQPADCHAEHGPALHPKQMLAAPDGVGSERRSGAASGHGNEIMPRSVGIQAHRHDARLLPHGAVLGGQKCRSRAVTE